jgi:hypothetical protein
VIVNLMGCKTCFIADHVISNQYHVAHDYSLSLTDFPPNLYGASVTLSDLS